MSTETSFDADGVQWAWDATSIKAAERCGMYYKYTILEGWERPGNMHLFFGRVYASSVEMLHKALASGTDYEEALIEVVRYALTETWVDGAPWETGDPNKNRENLIRTVIWFAEEFREDPLETYHTADGHAAVEFSFRLNVDNGITFCGHIDRLVVDPQGDIYPTDNKTTKSTISPYFFEGFKPDSQMSMYAFAGKMIYNVPVKGVIIDAAQIAAGFTRFGRAPTYRTDDELNEWYEETMDLILETQARTREGRLRHNPAGCSMYGGCPFRSVCSRPPKLRPNFLRADFDQRKEKWDPIKAR